MPIFREQVGWWTVYNANIMLLFFNLVKYSSLIVTDAERNCWTNVENYSHRWRLWWRFPKTHNRFLSFNSLFGRPIHRSTSALFEEGNTPQTELCRRFSNQIKVGCVFYFLISITMYNIQVCGRAGGSALVCGLGSAGKTPDNPKLINAEDQLETVWSTCTFRLTELNMKLWK